MWRRPYPFPTVVPQRIDEYPDGAGPPADREYTRRMYELSCPLQLGNSARMLGSGVSPVVASSSSSTSGAAGVGCSSGLSTSAGVGSTPVAALSALAVNGQWESRVGGQQNYALVAR